MKPRYFFLAVLWPVLLGAADVSWPNCSEALSAGRRSLDAGVPEAAAKAFEFVFATCGGGVFDSDVDQKFYLGLSRHLVGIQSDRPHDERIRLLSEAKVLYEDVIAQQPQRYAAVFNLGLVEAKLGNTAAARMLLQRAALGTRSSWYVAAYGRFLLGAGDVEGARREIEDAAERDPSSVEVQIAVFELALKSSRYVALSELDALSETWPRTLLIVAVRQLAERSWTDDEARRLWTMVVRALAAEPHEPSNFTTTPAGTIVASLARDKKNEAAAELLHLHVRPSQRSPYAWWAANPLTLAAFWKLVGVLGAEAERRSDVQTAYAYYYMLLTANPGGVSRAAVLNLARLYTVAGDSISLAGLDERYTPYFVNQASRLEAVSRLHYDYHREFGILYASLSRRGYAGDGGALRQSSNTDRAISHMTWAVEAAEKCIPRCGWEVVEPEPELLDLLAECQERVGKNSDAAANYVTALGLYVDQNNLTRARAVIQRIERTSNLREALSEKNRAIVSACASVTAPACAALSRLRAPQVADVEDKVTIPHRPLAPHQPTAAPRESIWARIMGFLSLSASVTAPGTSGVVTAVDGNTVTVAGANGQTTTYTLTSSTYVYNAAGSRANKMLLSNGQRVMVWSTADNTAVRINVEN